MALKTGRNQVSALARNSRPGVAGADLKVGPSGVSTWRWTRFCAGSQMKALFAKAAGSAPPRHRLMPHALVNVPACGVLIRLGMNAAVVWSALRGQTFAASPGGATSCTVSEKARCGLRLR